MEVKNQPEKMVRDYWPRYRRNAIILTILMQVAAAGAISFALIAAGVTTVSIQFWITIIAVLVATSGLNIILLMQLLTPLKDIAHALTHISGEPNAITPPNPNAHHFERDGFKPLLQLIYDKARSSDTSLQDKKIADTFDVSSALDTSFTGVIMLDDNRNIVYANAAAPLADDTEGGRHLSLLFNNDDTLEKWLDMCDKKSVQAEHVWTRVSDKVTGAEGRRIFDVVGSYRKGSQAEVILTLFDRTELYQPEDDSLDFIAFAAHELRGPITVIRGYLDVLGDELDGQIADDQKELLHRLVVSSNRLSSYVNNILNASRYDRRHLKVHLGEESLSSIYDTISDDMNLRASAQSRLLSVNIPADLPTVAADRASISEVLGNLIDNAIKYSNTGGSVIVSAKIDGESVKVSVQDQGIGMPGSVVSNLFHKFYRSHRSRETVAGTGIGLYICKAIVESHGGRIGVKSAEGEGSTFYFSLPIYETVAEKLRAGNNSSESMIEHGESWIKNHAMYRG